MRKAASLFNGLRIVARFIDRKRFFDEADTVESGEQTADGVELAQIDYVCDDHEDCNDCLYSGLCSCLHPSRQ